MLTRIAPSPVPVGQLSQPNAFDTAADNRFLTGSIKSSGLENAQSKPNRNINGWQVSGRGEGGVNVHNWVVSPLGSNAAKVGYLRV